MRLLAACVLSLLVHTALASCNGNNGSVRVVGGSGPWEGILEIQHDGQWGTICDDDFEDIDASVACRSLGYPHGWVVQDAVVYFRTNHNATIMLDDVHCTGSEVGLEQCMHSGWYSHNCVHEEDVGVVCALPRDGSISAGGVSSTTSTPTAGNACDYCLSCVAGVCGECEYGFGLDPLTYSCVAGTYCNADCKSCFTNGTCLECYEGFALDPAVDYCVACPAGCDGCVMDHDVWMPVCDGCLHDYIPDNHNNCIPCPQGCPTECVLDADAAMATCNCPDDQTFDHSQGICVDCSNNCLMCNYDTAWLSVSCNVCDMGYTVDISTGPGYCRACPNNCLSCTASDFGCDSNGCASGFVRNPYHSNECDACPEVCSTDCKLDNSNMVPACDCVDGQTFDTVNGLCIDCGDGCAICSFRAMDGVSCSHCDSGYRQMYLDGVGVCY